MAPPSKALADQQTTTAEPAPTTLHDDAEHDPKDAKAAKAASNAALKKEANKHAAHAASDTASFGTAEAGLTALAAQFAAWKPLIDRETDRKSGPGSSGPGIEFLTTTLHAADSMTWRVQELIDQSDSVMKPKLGAQVQKAMGAFDAVQHSLERANDWIEERGAKPAANITLLRNRVYGYADAISTLGLKPDAVPTGTSLADAMSNLIAQDLFSIKTDIASVEAGNSADASRLNIHVMNLELNTRIHLDVLKAKAKESHIDLKALAAKLHTLDQKPEYHGRFAESVQKLQVMGQ